MTVGLGNFHLTMRLWEATFHHKMCMFWMFICKLKLLFNNMYFKFWSVDINTISNHHIFPNINNNIVEVISNWMKNRYCTVFHHLTTLYFFLFWKCILIHYILYLRLLMAFKTSPRFYLFKHPFLGGEGGWLWPWHAGVPRPGIKPVPPLLSKARSLIICTTKELSKHSFW